MPLSARAGLAAALACALLVAACGTSQPQPTDTATTLRTYLCDPLGEAVARYDNTMGARPAVHLTVAGQTRELLGVVAASGARYATERGLTPDYSLIWWATGQDEALLMELPLDDTARMEDARLLATCRPTS